MRAIEKLLTFIHVKNQLGTYSHHPFRRVLLIVLTLHEKLVGCGNPNNSGVYIIVYAMEHRQEFSLYANNVSTLAPLQEFLHQGPYIRICVHGCIRICVHSPTGVEIRAYLHQDFLFNRKTHANFFPKLNLKS